MIYDIFVKNEEFGEHLFPFSNDKTYKSFWLPLAERYNLKWIFSIGNGGFSFNHDELLEFVGELKFINDLESFG